MLSKFGVVCMWNVWGDMVYCLFLELGMFMVKSFFK